MNEEQPKKSLSYASIVLTGIAVSVAISLLGGALDSEFIRLFGIIGPSAWAGQATSGRKPLKGFKQWAAFIVPKRSASSGTKDLNDLLSMKTFRFKRFSLTIDTLLAVAFVFSVIMSAGSIAVTCENILDNAPWWHTAFTAVKSVIFVTAVVCCVLKALQPHRPGRFRFYHSKPSSHMKVCSWTIRVGWIGFSSLCPSPGGVSSFTSFGECATRTEKGSKKQFEQRINRMI